MRKTVLIVVCLVVLSVLVAVPMISLAVHRGGHHHGGYRGPSHPHYYDPCFVATAAYGDPNHRHVQILREFRDNWLVGNPAGEAFIGFYYKNGPAAAQFIGEHEYLKPAVRAALLPIVGISWCLNAAAEGG